jgi:hypothetical protein
VRRVVCLVAILAAIAAPGAAAANCHSDVRFGVLPVWARTGFTSPKPRMPHVLGRAGDIVAIIFGYPLHSPPSPKRNNKILWVSRTPLQRASELRISAQRLDLRGPIGKPVARVVQGGPGPSIIDLPASGCWRLTLRWSGRTDHLDLRYVR